MIYVVILLAVAGLGIFSLARMARRTEREKGVHSDPHVTVPSDVSPVGDVKVPAMEGDDTKDTVLNEGPIGSRPDIH